MGATINTVNSFEQQGAKDQAAIEYSQKVSEAAKKELERVENVQKNIQMWGSLGATSMTEDKPSIDLGGSGGGFATTPSAGGTNKPKSTTSPQATPTKKENANPTATQSGGQCNTYAQKAKSTCSSALSSVNGLSSSFSSFASQLAGQQQASAANACAQMEQNLRNTSSQISSYQSSCQSEVTSCQANCSDGDNGQVACAEANVDLGQIGGQLSQVNASNTTFRNCRADATTGESNADALQSAMNGSAFQNLNSSSGSSSIYQSPTSQATATATNQMMGMAQPQVTTGNSNTGSVDSSLGNPLGDSVESLVNSKYQKSEMTRTAEQNGGSGTKVGGSAAVATNTNRDGLQLLAGRSRYDTQINQGSYDEGGGRRVRASAANNWDSASSMAAGAGSGRRYAGSRADDPGANQVDLTRFLPGGQRGVSFGPGGSRRGPASDSLSNEIAGPHTSLFRLQRSRYNIVPTVYTDHN